MIFISLQRRSVGRWWEKIRMDLEGEVKVGAAAAQISDGGDGSIAAATTTTLVFAKDKILKLSFSHSCKSLSRYLRQISFLSSFSFVV